MLNPSYKMLDRKRQGLLKKMAKAGPFFMATVSQRTTKCGNKQCGCQKEKRKRYPTFRLSWTNVEGNGTCYVPKDIQEDVLEWREKLLLEECVNKESNEYIPGATK